MKKIVALLMASLLMLTLAACGGAPATSGSDAPADDKKGAEIAQIVIQGGSIDDNSFNQGAWEGIQEYAKENDVSHKYYQATEDTVDGFVNAIDLAIKSGAKIVVTPGYVFEPAIFEAQDVHPDVDFILLDGTPQDGNYEEYRIEDNVSSVFYAEEQAGFLAGYAAVKEGYRNLGFIGGMAVPAVMKFGYGFVQGAEYAGEELGLKEGDIDLKYTYVGNFEASPENQTLAASWYQSGTEVIFASGGPVGFSVMAAAEQADAKVIGVDSDQSNDSPTVITSAVKNLDRSVYDILGAYYAGEFPGGKETLFDVTNEGVGLPMDTSKFENFTQEDYDAIYQILVEDKDGVTSGMLKDTDAETADEIETSIVKITVV